VGLKDRLATRPRPTTTFPLRIDDDRVARLELTAAEADEDEDRIVAARLAVDACYEQLTITALSPVAMEELREAHPPTEEQRKKHGALFNPTTFVPALLAACVDSDVSEEDWAEYTTTGAMTPGEVNALFAAAWELHYATAPSPDLPKG
jgi:hypothetical protein